MKWHVEHSDLDSVHLTNDSSVLSYIAEEGHPAVTRIFVGTQCVPSPVFGKQYRGQNSCPQGFNHRGSQPGAISHPHTPSTLGGWVVSGVFYWQPEKLLNILYSL